MGLFWQPLSLRSLQLPNSLGDHVYVVWALFGSLGDHYSHHTTSEVKYDLRFEISDPNCLLIHVHIASMVWALLAASEAMAA